MKNQKVFYGNVGGGPKDHREHVQHSAGEPRTLPTATASLFLDDAEELYPSLKPSLVCEEASYSHPSRTRSLGTWDQMEPQKGPGDSSLPPPPSWGYMYGDFYPAQKAKLNISLCSSVSFYFFAKF